MMKAGVIVKAVRCCIDEESVNSAGLLTSAFDFDGSVTDTGLMNNIIKNKIPAALRWVCLYAPAEQLSGGLSSNDGESGESGGETDPIDIIKEVTDKTTEDGFIELDSSFVRLIRVRGDKWHRAVSGDSVLKEDSDEYLQLRDNFGAEATEDRPQAALINTKVKQVEVRPYQNDKFTITYVVTPSSSTFAGLDGDNWENVDVGVPPMVETSFIYYLAYLLLTAYGDARAKSMFDVATLNLGRSEDKQRQ